MKRGMKRALAFITAIVIAAVLIIKPGDGVVTVQAEEVTMNVGNVAELDEAFRTSEDVKVTLTDNINITTSYNAKKSMTIDLNGHTITDNRGDGIFKIADGAHLIITDSSGGGMLASSAPSAIYMSGGTLEISGGQIQSTGTGGASVTAINMESGTLNISGGQIKSIGSNGKAIKASAGTINITGETIISSQYIGLDIYSTSADAKLTAGIKGGSLSGSFAALQIGSYCEVTIGADG